MARFAPASHRRGLRRLAAATTLAAAGCVAYGSLIETRWFRLRREVLPGALRPSTPGPLRVLHVSDLHLSRPRPALERFVRDLASVDADLVVSTGDLLGDAGAEDRAASLLATLTADGTPGVGVLGSNDYFGPTAKSPHIYFTAPDARTYGRRLDTDRLRSGLRDAGWTLLENRRESVATAAGLVEVAGLIDPHFRHLALPSAASLEPVEPAAVLRLGLVHAPYRGALRLLTEAGYRTVLAGHTHGGQVRLPPVGALVTNCDLPTDLARGSSRLDGDGWLHVSAGLGQSKFAPFRFACRPEASLLELLP